MCCPSELRCGTVFDWLYCSLVQTVLLWTTLKVISQSLGPTHYIAISAWSSKLYADWDMVVCVWWSVAWCYYKCLRYFQLPHGLWCHSQSKTAQFCLYELTYDINIVQSVQLEPSLCVWIGTEMYSCLQCLFCLLCVGDEWEAESLCGVGWTSVIAPQWSTSYPSRVDDHRAYHGGSWLWDHSLCGALPVANTVWCAEWLWCQDSIIHWEVCQQNICMYVTFFMLRRSIC